MHPLTLFLGAFIALVPVVAMESAPDANALCRSAMTPYYAALLASARGDADGTIRHLLVLKSRWDAVTRPPETDLPTWLRDAATKQPVSAAVAARIDSARRHLPRDVSGAHAELEAIRVLLRDARVRHGVPTGDDAVTDYHEAMERLSNHIGASNEFALTPSDFTVIREEVERAQTAWAQLESFPELTTPVDGWAHVAANTTNALATIANAADRRDAATAQQTSGVLKNRYLDLLSLLSRQ